MLFFQKTKAIETGLSNHQKLICTFFESCFERLKPKIFYYRNYKKFSKWCQKLRLQSEDWRPKQKNNLLTITFINIVNKHAPLKKKFMRGNQAPFTTKNLRKESYTKSRFRNKFCKNLTKENGRLYKKQRSKMYKRILLQHNW